MFQVFKVTRTKTGKTYTVYSVQILPAQNIAGQGMLASLFLIYDDEKKRWEMAEAGEFEPIEDTKVAIQ